ncbi:hypothetical protein Q8W71_07010 [Methylobacterium sp. NEAU 140]|uniref:hypothetical protein n=1 Tax=Methylobacterium sp. NEAU 140 TaxID=3064945 RepID=UPI0027329968|nr:hypothetical protein [Methylobacterium sp. NEAU 140]MDP4022365.1 hypothetical protein [Methylobacterium sp. NEAU 140]
MSYAAVVGLDSLPGGGSELYFHIVEADGSTGGERLFWSGKDTGFITDVSDRRAVMDAVLLGLGQLLARVAPPEFRWFTHDERPPKKALLKFAAIRRAVEGCGYTVSSSRLPLGRRAWHAVRAAPVPVDRSAGGSDPAAARVRP